MRRAHASPTTLSGGWLVPLSIASTRSSVGSTIGRKSVQRFSSNSRLQVLLGVGLEQPRRRALERLPLQVRLVERTGEALDHSPA